MSARFDWRQMHRFGIRDSNLPDGSSVYFREPTVWQRYSSEISLILAIIVVQAALIAVCRRWRNSAALPAISRRFDCQWTLTFGSRSFIWSGGT